MAKYDLIPQQLIYQGIITHDHLFTPNPCAEELILLTHEQDYWSRMKRLQLSEREMRKIGFPLSEELIYRERIIAQGTIDCALFAKKYGVSLNVAGGTHHAFAHSGEGFCLLNDFAIAANYLLAENICKQILIIDLDVHQGNGTASIFSGQPKVYTLSMHGGENYPLHKEFSDLDVELPSGCSDDIYINLMHQYIPKAIEEVQPDFIFYLSGVDILSSDKYGKLNISGAGCRQRDQLIFEWCRQFRIPVACAMGGGYSPILADIVNAHCETFKLARDVFF
jgi:acetoin utilization deacetylase AcuC-like enzyme